ncbi:aldo/keto reductase [Aspergillus homomorphus CBS 101889]|uniref:Aldo/keto reductase n=1 Tax=Aspergillus homomorphus (strain CBS 101889) TaxID=1450537 RepID=A0A395I8L7_ASPHC|nr:aldo/keto reductase [Aspergillus homomorphus CBS 101889]RAL16336.1 aldo/keto reductase [Aspergillus homomorphus CBS 101889]
MSFVPPPPKSLLGRYRPLAPAASVKVSPICLGSMNFGDAWKSFMGECGKKSVFEILDAYYQAGGNFIDTADNYQNEESEIWIGEWLEDRGVRDQIVLATKYSTGYRAYQPDEIQANFVGNNTKSLHVAVNASLKKLRTSYIDVLYLHWWDFATSIEEIMQSLNQLVATGKVLYLGVSDTPAWVVSKANQYARDHGLRPFSVYQGRWSASRRDFERDILAMAQSEGMGLAPWGVLGSGSFKSRQERVASEGEGHNSLRRMIFPPTAADTAVSEVLERISLKHETSVAGVALAYVSQKAPYVFPIIGCRKVEHLKSSIDALRVSLTQEDMDDIEAAAPFDLGFPMNFLFPSKSTGPANVQMMNVAGHFDYVKAPEAIRPQSIN